MTTDTTTECDPRTRIHHDLTTIPSHREDDHRSNDMFSINEDLARAHIDARLAEARHLRAGAELSRARRLSRKAERAAQQARLAIARAL